MRTLRAVVVLALAVSFAGCYKATVHTGLAPAPSGERVEKAWAHGFLYGLVPPSEVEVRDRCPNGVSRVETELSFTNQLAAILTGWLYTPMTIRAVCAAPAVAR